MHQAFLYALLLQQQSIVGALQCADGWRFVPSIGGSGTEGHCEACPTCDGGGFIANTSVTLRWHSDHGFITCFPCVPCPRDTFRVSGTSQECLMCVKSCDAVHRFVSKDCGGSSPGHCGECYDGYVARTKDPEGMCEPKPPETTGYKLLPSPRDDSRGLETISVNAHASATINFDWQWVWILAGCGLIIILALLALRRKRIKTLLQNCLIRRDYAPASSTTLSTSTTVVEFSTGTDISTLSDKDLETDGPDLVRAEKVGEASIEELTALNPGRANERYIYPQRKLDPSDDFTQECLLYVSSNVSGEHERLDFCNTLGVQSQEYNPQLELFEKQRQSHSEFLYKVLQTWLQRTCGTPSADLSHLCESLSKAKFHRIANRLLNKHNNWTERKIISPVHSQVRPAKVVVC